MRFKGCHQTAAKCSWGQIGRVLLKHQHRAAFGKTSAARFDWALHLCLSRLSVPFFFLCILHFTERLRCVLKGAATDFDPHSHLDGSLNKSISFSLSISSTMCSMFASTFPQYCSVVHQPRNSFFFAKNVVWSSKNFNIKQVQLTLKKLIILGFHTSWYLWTIGNCCMHVLMLLCARQWTSWYNTIGSDHCPDCLLRKI